MPKVIEKRTGHDWTVIFRDPDDNNLITGIIFGVNTAGQAISQAHIDMGMPEEADIVAIIRRMDHNEIIKKIS